MSKGAKKGQVVVISGPSGVGKSTICREVVKRLADEVYRSVSMTTREQAAMEVEGQDYWFVSRDEFKAKLEADQLLEWAEVFGNYYGTPKEKVAEALGEGKTVVLEIDVQGGRQAKAVYPDAKLIFILPPDQRELAKRISLRGRDKPEVAAARLRGSEHETAAAWQFYDHMVINADLEEAIEEVIRIIKDGIGDVK